MSEHDDIVPPEPEKPSLFEEDLAVRLRPEARERPEDPAGTRPRHDPQALLPARRPEFAGDPAHGPGLLPARRVGDPIEGEGPRPHLARFQFLRGALVALGAVAVVVAVALIADGGNGSNDEETTAWSTFQPQGDALQATAQIGDYVGSHYRTAGGEQLALAAGGPLAIYGQSVTGSPLPVQIVVQATAAQGGDLIPVGGSTALYSLCGIGGKVDCSLPGTPTAQRGKLVRREALEMALYTFHYVKDVDNVLVVLPPTVLVDKNGKPVNAPGAKTSTTPTTPATGAAATGTAAADPTAPLKRIVLFTRETVAPELARPLASTLTVTPPALAKIDKAPDTATVENVTLKYVFDYSVVKNGLEDRVVLLLQPPSA